MIDVYSDRHGVLKNKLNIKDSKQLEHAERLIALQNIAQLRKASFDKFDLDTLKAIHKKIFNSIYNWAGEIRTVNIQKGTMQFCDYSYITEQANGIFKKVAEQGNFKGLSKDEFCGKAAELFNNINALHPFREGNGRAQREFIFHLAKTAGYELDLNKADKEQYMNASKIGVVNDRPMELLMRSIIKDYQKENEVEKAKPRKKRLTIQPKEKNKSHER